MFTNAHKGKLVKLVSVLSLEPLLLITSRHDIDITFVCLCQSGAVVVVVSLFREFVLHSHGLLLSVSTLNPLQCLSHVPSTTACQSVFTLG